LEIEQNGVESGESSVSFRNTNLERGNFREVLDAAAYTLPGVTRSISRWNSFDAYALNGVEFAHFHDENTIDIRIPRKLLSSLSFRATTLRMHSFVRIHGDWVEVQSTNPFSEECAVFLLRIAYEAVDRKPR
jgi:hypothetical protein